jgi:glycosyltransferase involved in cell wall biosynthesis
MTSAPTYSVIIPVYNRPEEMSELLESLTQQTIRDFEVVVVEDGSAISSESIVNRYQSKIQIRYFTKKNEGPGPARNFGYHQARGKYLVAFDSDCIIPSDYFKHVEEGLTAHALDAWGGPDKAHENFTILQRAMGYTMSSVLTTGGIRGGKKHLGWFQPRSFNMGISRKVFEVTNGFAFTRFAEDIEFSIRMRKAGFRVGLIEKAYVFHKRRTTFGQFFKQVFNFGKGRALLASVHPEEIKLTHWFPTLFTLACIGLIALPLIDDRLFLIAAGCFGIYFLSIFCHALIATKNLAVALFSIPSAFLQLTGYGLGFLKERVKTYLRK